MEWATVDILVKIASRYSDPKLADKVGYIKNISGNICNVFVEEEQRVVGITSDYLEPITPEKSDKVFALAHLTHLLSYTTNQ